MMKKLYFVLVSGILLSATSCSGIYSVRSARSTSFAPDEVRLSLSMSDMEFLGETEISTFTRVYFGIIFRLDSLNGQEYDRRAVTRVHLRGEKDVNLPRVMKKALYKAMDDYPEADYYMPVYVKTERERMFLGRYVTRKALIRAYRIRKVEVSGEVSEEITEEVSVPTE